MKAICIPQITGSSLSALVLGLLTVNSVQAQIQTSDLLEYGLSTDTIPYQQPIVIESSGGGHAFRFMRGRADLDYQIQGSSNLRTWDPLMKNPGVVGSLVEVPFQTKEASQFMRISLERPRTFFEPFTFSGPHSSTVNGGNGTTVWWNADHWDCRIDTGYATLGFGQGHHIDIHNASADLTDGRRDNTVYAVNGDGSTGVGVMHLEFQGIVSARLRNPMLISAERPGEVSFYANRFVTTGHWWEVAISPAEQYTSGGLTNVPDSVEAEPQQGPGNYPPEDSINMLLIGESDIPCLGNESWQVIAILSKRDQGVSQHIARRDDPFPTDPSEKDELYLWKLRYFPDHIELHADFEQDGTLELKGSYAMTVPWPEVHVHLMGVAYQADHHPQDECHQGEIRELSWRDVRISPVKYATTSVYPKNIGAENVPKSLGWRSFDLRDTQRVGPAINDVPQPNLEGYDVWTTTHWYQNLFFSEGTEGTNFTLTFPKPIKAGHLLTKATLLYDIREIAYFEEIRRTDSAVSLTLNETDLGRLPDARSIAGAEQNHFVRRSFQLDPTTLNEGDNTLTFNLSGTAPLEMDRLEVEFIWEEE